MKLALVLLASVLSTGLSMTAQAAPAQTKAPRLTKQTLGECKTSALKFATAAINSGELVISGFAASTADANEKVVSLIGSDKETGAPIVRVRFAAVNREVGFNMEGEWQVTVDVTTTSDELSAQSSCSVSSAKIKTGLPKDVRF